MASSSKPKIRNRLLASLPKAELESLAAHLQPIRLEVRHVLYEPNKDIRDVYFVEDGIVSLISTMDDGKMIEIGTVGNEGMVGLPAFLGARTSPLQAFAQVPGDAWKISRQNFEKALHNGSSSLARELHRYTQALFVQLSQSVACNRLHSIDRRAAKWLLFTHDRVGRDVFDLSQQFIAQMLGTRRASVNATLQGFRRKGMLDYRNGKMTIKNRRKLESASCECYFIIRDEYQRLT